MEAPGHPLATRSEPEGEPVLAAIKSWDPLIELPDYGTYTIVMSLGGIAGTGGARLTVNVAEPRRVACGSAPPAGVGGALLAFACAGLRRRRR